jgi:hypothetical protein
MPGCIVVAELVEGDLLSPRYIIVTSLGGTGDIIKAPRSNSSYRAVRSVEVRNPMNTFFEVCKRLETADGRHPELEELLAALEYNCVLDDMPRAPPQHAACCVVS